MVVGPGMPPVEVAALVVSPFGDVLLRRRAAVWETLHAASHTGESPEEALGRVLGEGARIAPLDSYLLTTLTLPLTPETAVYVVQDWQGELSLHDDLQFFPLDALPLTAVDMDRAALRELRLCWGFA